MKWHCLIPVICMAATAGCASPAPEPAGHTCTEESACGDFSALKQKVSVIEKGPHVTGYSLLLDGYYEKEFKDKEALAEAKRAGFAEWLKYEDEFVSFYYPKSPYITLEVDKGARIMGEPVTMGAENTFFRRYSLTVEGKAYCVILLDRKDHFDEGICFCGPEVFHKFLFRNGSLYRFSLLESGEVKKVQILRSGLRVVFFEWTHMPMHQDMYLKLAAGLAIKGKPCDEAAVKRGLVERYGFLGKFGLIESGMSRQQVLALLGQPQEETESLLTYKEVAERSIGTYRVPLAEGVFRSLPKDSFSCEILPPKKGTLDWMVEKAEKGTIWEVKAEYDLGPLTPEDASLIFDKFAEMAPSAKRLDWTRFCRAVLGLHKNGYRDDRVLPVLRKRYAELQLHQDWAEDVLNLYDPKGSQSIFLSRAKAILKILEETKPDPDADVALTGWDLHNLFRLLDKSNPECVEIVLRSMAHPNASVREVAFGAREGLPADRVLTKVITGLSDKDNRVRVACAEAFSDDVGGAENLPFLKECLEREKSDDVKFYLQRAIERLSK